MEKTTQTLMERIFDPPTRRRLRRLFIFFVVVAVLAVGLLVYDWVRDAGGADDPGSAGSTTTVSASADGLGGTSPSDRGRGGVVAALGEVVRYGRQKTVTVADRKYYCENVITQAQREGAVQCNPPKPGRDRGQTIAEVTDVDISGRTATVIWTARYQYGALDQQHDDFAYQDGRWRWQWIDHSTGRTGK